MPLFRLLLVSRASTRSGFVATTVGISHRYAKAAATVYFTSGESESVKRRLQFAKSVAYASFSLPSVCCMEQSGPGPFFPILSFLTSSIFLMYHFFFFFFIGTSNGRARTVLLFCLHRMREARFCSKSDFHGAQIVHRFTFPWWIISGTAVLAVNCALVFYIWQSFLY